MMVCPAGEVAKERRARTSAGLKRCFEPPGGVTYGFTSSKVTTNLRHAHTTEPPSREDIELEVQGLTEDQLWQRPGGSAAIGFHLHHLPGSLERLLTYSRGESLSAEQMARLASERTVHKL